MEIRYTISSVSYVTKNWVYHSFNPSNIFDKTLMSTDIHIKNIANMILTSTTRLFCAGIFLVQCLLNINIYSFI